MHKLAELDLRYVWHPFTQMRDWLGREPIVIIRGKGAVLWDVHGRKYLDANSSIWTNLHGHRHPVIDRAIRRQLKKIAHSSALGLANEPAALLAERLIRGSRLPGSSRSLEKVFFSDDGSTAMEVALKLSFEYWRRNGVAAPRFLSLQSAYHGDTVGAASLGHIGSFHERFRGLLFKSDAVMAPYCYRCPFNRAKPERADAREYRKCHWECVGEVERQFAAARKERKPITTFVVEPLIQGAAGMIPQPRGWLGRVARITRDFSAHLIADEVMTAFGRASDPGKSRARLLACQDEGVVPDLAALAKGLSGGYLPLAATLTSRAVFDAFLGEYHEFKTFFHGHSYTANQLGCAAALASLDLLETRGSIGARRVLAAELDRQLQTLWTHPQVGDIRRVGLAAGIELARDWRTRQPYDLREQAGIRVCAAMAKRGVLTRPIGNVIVLMPPFCATRRQVRTIVQALSESIKETL